MSIRPTVLPLREGYCIHTTASGHEPDLAASAQTVDGEKHLVPREVGAVTRDLFEVAGLGTVEKVDHLIFCGEFLRHVPPFEERNELLSGGHCIVGASGESRVKTEGEVR